MNRPVFLGAELSFGRHDGAFRLPTDHPAVVAGPNGSGKTTFVDGLLRTVFGFNRRSADDRRLADARRPWDERPFRSAVRLAFEEEIYEWARDHDTDHVRVVDDHGVVVFDGTANPAAQSSSDRAYWAFVRRVFGVTDLEAYARTAFVGQGRLLDGTEFGAGLLRLADGGHARWKAACQTIEERHRELTREAISPGHRRGNRDRRLEELEAEHAELRERLAGTRAAVRTRASTAERLAEVEREIEQAEAELGEAEALRLRLAERARLDAQIADARQRFDRLVDLREDLAAARREVDDAEAECARLDPGTPYPDDFPARVAGLRAAWTELERLAEQRERDAAEPAAPVLSGRVAALLVIGVLLAGAGAWIGIATAAWGWIFSGLGLAVAGLGTADLRARRSERGAAEAEAARRRERRAALERDVDELRRDVPGAAALKPGNLDRHLERFERLRAARARREAARARRSEVMRRVEKAGEAEDRPGRDLPHLEADAGRRLTALEEQLRELGAGDEETPLSTRAVDARLARDRAALAELREEHYRLRLAQDRTARAVGDLARFVERAADLEARIAETRSSVAALRAAHALLRDGYDEFRDQDEARLVSAVSGHLEALGEPPLGPFRTESGLEEPTVGLARRRLAFDSPELSHGQRHLVSLAIRLGAADFLSLDGPATPLIVDEPFAHLDDRHAAQVWNLLADISVHRQVVVTTQEEDLLERLGVEPSVRLAGDGAGIGAEEPAARG